MNEQFEVQSVDTEVYPPSQVEMEWQTVATATNVEDAYDLYIAEFDRIRARVKNGGTWDGLRGRVQVLLNGKPITLDASVRRHTKRSR
jgi:hypothetical protein